MVDTAGSAGGISPPAAHRTVRKPLDLYGSSQLPLPSLDGKVRRESPLLLPIARLAAASPGAESSPLLHAHYKRFITRTG
jgi:hypothetical protein